MHSLVTNLQRHYTQFTSYDSQIKNTPLCTTDVKLRIIIFIFTLNQYRI